MKGHSGAIVAVLGATGKTGRPLVARLCDDGHRVVAIGRDPERLETLDRRASARLADLDHPPTVTLALEDAERVVSLAHARYIPALLECLPPRLERLVVTGSTRVFSRLPDPAVEAVRAGERAFLAAGIDGVMLHPSLVYGAPEDRTVNRLLGLIRRFPVLPLPDGGRHSVQPIFVDDAVAAFAAAVVRPEAPGPPIVLAGPEAIPYREMVTLCARALGRRPLLVPVPVAMLATALRAAETLGLAPPVAAAEVLRSGEDKAFDVAPMVARLGVRPRPFAEGLALVLAGAGA